MGVVVTETKKNWYVYMIKSSDESLYTGITTDLDRRFQQHLKGKGGAKYFQGRRPEKIVYTEAGHDRSSASIREAEIKSFSRNKKILIVNAAKNLILN